MEILSDAVLRRPFDARCAGFIDPGRSMGNVSPLGLACSAGPPDLCFDVSPLGSKLLHQKCRTSRRRKGCSGMQMHTRRLV